MKRTKSPRRPKDGRILTKTDLFRAVGGETTSSGGYIHGAPWSLLRPSTTKR
jgi:hypothetical protein